MQIALTDLQLAHLYVIFPGTRSFEEPLPDGRRFSTERILCHDYSLPYSALNGRDCSFKQSVQWISL